MRLKHEKAYHGPWYFSAQDSDQEWEFWRVSSVTETSINDLKTRGILDKIQLSTKHGHINENKLYKCYTDKRKITKTKLKENLDLQKWKIEVTEKKSTKRLGIYH